MDVVSQLVTRWSTLPYYLREKFWHFRLSRTVFKKQFSKLFPS